MPININIIQEGYIFKQTIEVGNHKQQTLITMQKDRKPAVKKQAKKNFSSLSFSNASHMSALQSQFPSLQQLSQLNMYDSDSMELQQELAIVARKEINFNEREESVAQLKVRENIIVQEIQEDEMYYVTPCKKRPFEEYKEEPQPNYQIEALIYEKIGHQLRKTNPTAAKALYRVKKEKGERSMVNLQQSSRASYSEKQYLQICD